MQLRRSFRAHSDGRHSVRSGVSCPQAAAHRRCCTARTCRVRDALTPSVLEEDGAVPSTSVLEDVDIELARVQLETVLEKQSAGALAAPTVPLYSSCEQLHVDSPAHAPETLLLAEYSRSHQWGTGLTVPQFMAALQALPLQKQVRWKSLYPAIGAGSRGRVYQAVNLDTGGMLAVKVVTLSSFLGPSPESALRREALVLELAAMQDYDHPHLLGMQGFYFKPSLGSPRLEIYSELGCCLEDLLPDLEGGERLLDLTLVAKALQALVRALAFLHDKGVVHRDVKAGNIVSVGCSGTFKLIDMDSIFFVNRLWDHQHQHEQQHQQQQWQVGGSTTTTTTSSSSSRLGSMGNGWLGAPAAALAAQAAGDVAAATLQQQQQEGEQDTIPSYTPAAAAGGGGAEASSSGGLNALSFAGTPENMAPEAAPLVLEEAVVLWDLIPWKEGRQVASGEPVDPARDIWSVGTVLWEMVVGRPLFHAFENPEQLYQHFEVLRCSPEPQALLPTPPAGVHPDVAEVLEACLRVDPSQRPSAQQLLQLDFFNKKY